MSSGLSGDKIDFGPPAASEADVRGIRAIIGATSSTYAGGVRTTD